MSENIKLETIKTSFLDIPCNETMHRETGVFCLLDKNKSLQKSLYRYYLHKYHPIYTDPITDYFNNSKDDITLNYFELLKMCYQSYEKCDFIDSTNPYGITLSSATLLKITDITNKYFADKRIYISGSLSPQLNYYIASRGNGKSLRTLYYFAKLVDCSSHIPFAIYQYPKEYKAHDYKFDMENLYKEKLLQKMFPKYFTNSSLKQRSNIQEEMSCLKIIADKNNTSRKFYK